MAKRPLGANPMVIQAAIQLFYQLADKLSEKDKTLLVELDDLEASDKVIKKAFYGRDIVEEK